MRFEASTLVIVTVIVIRDSQWVDILILARRLGSVVYRMEGRINCNEELNLSCRK